MKKCGFINCDNQISRNEPGAKIGYTVNNLNREVHACQKCAFKIMSAPRGTFHITKYAELKLNNTVTIIT